MDSDDTVRRNRESMLETEKRDFMANACTSHNSMSDGHMATDAMLYSVISMLYRYMLYSPAVSFLAFFLIPTSDYSRL
jgi:hypothetical protein